MADTLPMFLVKVCIFILKYTISRHPVLFAIEYSFQIATNMGNFRWFDSVTFDPFPGFSACTGLFYLHMSVIESVYQNLMT